MCLYADLKNNSGKIEDYVQVSNRDMVVYKILGKKFYMWTGKNEEEEYVTSARGYKVDKDGDILIADKFTCRKNEPFLEINRGIHSYTDLKEAKFQVFNPSIRLLVKCIIPAGTPYIKSSCGCQVVSLILMIPPIDRESIIDFSKN